MNSSAMNGATRPSQNPWRGTEYGATWMPSRGLSPWRGEIAAHPPGWPLGRLAVSHGASAEADKVPAPVPPCAMARVLGNSVGDMHLLRGEMASCNPVPASPASPTDCCALLQAAPWLVCGGKPRQSSVRWFTSYCTKYEYVLVVEPRRRPVFCGQTRCYSAGLTPSPTCRATPPPPSFLIAIAPTNRSRLPSLFLAAEF